jgi:hypothetical protein
LVAAFFAGCAFFVVAVFLAANVDLPGAAFFAADEYFLVTGAALEVAARLLFCVEAGVSALAFVREAGFLADFAVVPFVEVGFFGAGAFW